MDEEIVFLDLGFVFVKWPRLWTCHNLPVDVKVGIMARAYVCTFFYFPIDPAAQVCTPVGECLDRTVLVSEDIYPITVDSFFPSIDFSAIKVEQCWNTDGIIFYRTCGNPHISRFPGESRRNHITNGWNTEHSTHECAYGCGNNADKLFAAHLGGTGHLYLLVSKFNLITFKAGKTVFLMGAMSSYECILYFSDTGRSSYPAGIIVEHIMTG
jgi:hypothetical protein